MNITLLLITEDYGVKDKDNKQYVFNILSYFFYLNFDNIFVKCDNILSIFHLL